MYLHEQLWIYKKIRNRSNNKKTVWLYSEFNYIFLFIVLYQNLNNFYITTFTN